ncbi:AraC family transcriptional regulator [Cohnella hashimotonis]|uniref:AraC family transcriptional regulator n=1 Tax=Cohnella hashimotonis TaxID=2826895 RepID=A0ABT6TLQ4_9BACL|nr:AraC family transcriptional regulator [Cohnella hashimotonis]MDI4647756.1 AraC family transcriptional regulator [Cohnella hashimotonis]
MASGIMPDELYGTVRVNDAVIEIIEVLEEQPWGARSCPPHTHAWFECNYIYEGSMKTGFGGPLLNVGPGEFFLVPAGAEHRHEYLPESPHRGVCLRWTVAPAEPTAGGGAGSVYAALERLREWQLGCYEDRYGLGERILRLFEEAREADSLASVQLTFVQILLTIAAVRHPEGRVTPAGADQSDTAFLRKIEVYLNDERAEKMNVRRLADALHVSYNHLARKYKRLTGKTIVGRLTEIRLARALDLLRRTDASIGAIAEVSGFGAAHYFSRVFKDVYGVSPKTYRKGLNVEAQKEPETVSVFSAE